MLKTILIGTVVIGLLACALVLATGVPADSWSALVTAGELPHGFAFADEKEKEPGPPTGGPKKPKPPKDAKKPGGGPKGLKEPAVLKLLTHEAVLSELRVTDGQAQELASVREQFFQMSQESLKDQGLDAIEPKDRKQHEEVFRALEASAQDWLVKRLDVILTDGQMQRLREIDFQMRSADLGKDKALLAELKLTADQQHEIELVLNFERQELDTIRKTAREFYPEPEVQPYLKEQDELSKRRIAGEIQKILTPQQATTLQRLKGRPFDVALLKAPPKPAKEPKPPKEPKPKGPKPQGQPEL
jgi:hypothetical protein